MISRLKQMIMSQVNDEDCPLLHVLKDLLHCWHVTSLRVVPMLIITDLRPNSLHMEDAI